MAIKYTKHFTGTFAIALCAAAVSNVSQCGVLIVNYRMNPLSLASEN